MPAETRPPRPFDHVLLPEQVRHVAQRRAADVGHQLTEQEPTQPRLLPETVGDEIPLALLRDALLLVALRRHLGIFGVDEVLAFAAQQLEEVVGEDTFEDEIALLTKLLALRFADQSVLHISPAIPPCLGLCCRTGCSVSHRH